MPCPCAPTPTAAACFARELGAVGCLHQPTDPARVRILGQHCVSSASPAERGFVVASLAASGEPVCTGGDSYHAYAMSDGAQFATLSTPMAPSTQPHLYWVSVASSAATEPLSYRLTVTLVETQHRQLQHAEGLGSLRWSVDEATGAPVESPLVDFWRFHKCSWSPVPAAAALQVPAAAASSPTAAEPQCRGALSGLQPMAFVAVAGADGCGGGGRTRLCEGGSAHERLLNTSNANRLTQRSRKGYAHVLKPAGCRLRLYGEAELTRCLAGRQLLNMGTSLATDVAKGLARLNESLRAWTLRRPGTASEQRRSFEARLPQVADFHYQFERTGGFWHSDVMVGKSAFGRSLVTTMLLDHPPHYGLLNVLEPETVRRAVGRERVGFASLAKYEELMCKHDIVVFESGLHDVAMPFTEWVSRGRNGLAAACVGRAAADCPIGAATSNQTWRLTPLHAYREHLNALIGWGYSQQPHHVAVVNELARRTVTAAGFEAFDGSFGATLHALPRWFDDARGGLRHSTTESEALSDVVTQMLLNQLCGESK